MRKVLMLAVLAAFGVGFVAAGCGGDDGDGETLTREELIAQGDENCRQADQELEQSQPQERPSKQELDQFVTGTLVPNIQGQIDFLRNLNGPEADKEQVNEILDGAQEGIDELEQDPSQLEDGPAGQKLQAAGTQLQEFGFEDCGG
jgi:hypothetical protein